MNSSSSSAALYPVSPMPSFFDGGADADLMEFDDNLFADDAPATYFGNDFTEQAEPQNNNNINNEEAEILDRFTSYKRCLEVQLSALVLSKRKQDANVKSIVNKYDPKTGDLATAYSTILKLADDISPVYVPNCCPLFKHTRTHLPECEADAADKRNLKQQALLAEHAWYLIATAEFPLDGTIASTEENIKFCNGCCEAVKAKMTGTKRPRTPEHRHAIKRALIVDDMELLAAELEREFSPQDDEDSGDWSSTCDHAEQRPDEEEEDSSSNCCETEKKYKTDNEEESEESEDDQRDEDYEESD